MSERILGGRYQLQAQIGGGGMAVVYKAVDLLLGRTVAVKMLRDAYTNDDAFVRRFRQEAHAAARLSHPNIVNVYDVGVVDDEYYIVMEYVDGPTLKDVILEQAPLAVEDAVRISREICAALEHAHEHHIIHRDVKPHNILLTRSGMVKVADFGIARAVTGNTIADRQDTSVLGSVHYFSPEQARGGQTDVKSDIYSLGVVMYEMVTGKLPFSGDSPVSVALKHLREQFIEPRQLNKRVPQSVENVILRCLVKSPSGRYQDMAQVKADLDDALRQPNVPKFVMPFDETQATIAIPALGQHGLGLEEELAVEKRAWWKPVLWTFVGILVLLVGVVAAYYIVIDLVQVPNVNLPRVIGMTQQQAVAKLNNAGFSSAQIHEQTEPNANAAKGVVYDQNPEGPTPVKKNRDITLYVSSGAPSVTIPSLSGQPASQAEQTLINLGFAKDQIQTNMVQSTSYPTGQVISTTPPPGTSVAVSDTVTLNVSAGSTTQVPNVLGMSVDDATKALTAANLQVGPVTQVPYNAPNGRVFKISPYQSGDTVPAGTVIDLYVATNSADTANSTAPPDGSNNGTSTGTGGSSTNGNIPADAQVRSVTVTVRDPSGQPIPVKITITDVRGESDVVDQTIVETTTWTERVYVTQQMSGTVNIYENGQLKRRVPVGYNS